jgi:uncharacterized protein (TIGR03066 family)
MRALRLTTAVLFGIGIVAGVSAEDKKPDAAKEHLVGSWEVVKSDEGAPPAGTIVSFEKDGKMKITHKKDGKEETVEGTYTLDGHKLVVTLKREDKEVKHTVTIKKLTADLLSAENEEGKKAEFKKKK